MGKYWLILNWNVFASNIYAHANCSDIYCDLIMGDKVLKFSPQP